MKTAASTWKSVLFGYGLSIAFYMPLAGLLAWQQYRISADEHMRVTLAGVALVVCARFFSVALLTPPIFWIVARFPITEGHTARRIAGYLAGFAPFAALFALIRWIVLPPWYPETQHWGSRTLHALVGLTYTTLADELVFYLAIAVAAHAAVYFKRLQRNELEQLELKEALAQSELQTLQTQIQPHFLFNTLNGISSLVHSNPGRAELMILRLSSLLRRTLRQDGSDLVLLREEIRLAEDYLDIESMRLGNRMSVRWDVEENTGSLLVPPFMLQLLVENGVKHGVASSRGQGWIEIRARRGSQKLILEVKNSVGGDPREGMGVGHQNIRTRLTLLYGADAHLTFSRNDSVAVAMIDLPTLPDSEIAGKTSAVRELEPEMRL